jgi:hypothetical protein
MENATTQSASGPVTRTEILDLVDGAFDGEMPRTEDLVTVAIEHDARPAVIDVLRSLPSQPFQNRADLWTYLPDLPVE